MLSSRHKTDHALLKSRSCDCFHKTHTRLDLSAFNMEGMIRFMMPTLFIPEDLYEGNNY